MRPNVQNWPKASEGYLKEIFSKDKELQEEYPNAFNLEKGVPRSIRTVVVPEPGHVIIEADYKQAELFVLAGLAQDNVMWEHLTTPGKDMHDIAAITSFKLVVMMDGDVVPEEKLLEIARTMSEDDYDSFKYKHLTYKDQGGKIMSHAEFKSTIRVGAKAINFGIPYGRGAPAIVMQVEAETGNPVDINDIKQALETWHTIYAKSSEFLDSCQDCVLNPGYVENPWGRRRYFDFDPGDEAIVAATRREAGNFPIQSTVADTMALALHECMKRRDEAALNFRVINQIHDALVLTVPEKEVDATIPLLSEAMHGIKIPVGRGRHATMLETLQLSVDVEICEKRWSEK